MNINLCEKLKLLRNSKGNTQADLANYLGVSIQAVSKWECGGGYPDITLLPDIATFYLVTIDELLGTDELSKRSRIQEITRDYNNIRKHVLLPDGSLDKDYNIDEGIDLIRKAIQEFPNCWFFLQLLASDLWWKAKSCDGQHKYKLLEEAEMLCDRVLTKCPEERWKHTANSILCMIYLDTDRKEMALEKAYQSADMVDTVDYKLTLILDGEPLEKQLLRNMEELSRMLYDTVFRLINEFGTEAIKKFDINVRNRINYIWQHIE